MKEAQFAHAFECYQLPPPKLILDRNLGTRACETLKQLYADVYLVDLHDRELRPRDILNLSNNPDGIDITSCRFIEPNAVFYDWHVHEVFNEEPDEVYLPYGSGRLMENYVTWQNRSFRNSVEALSDARLKASVEKVISMNIFGSEPESSNSVADKLRAPFRPFQLFLDRDIRSTRELQFSGCRTTKSKVEDDYIIEARRIFEQEGNRNRIFWSRGASILFKET